MPEASKIRVLIVPYICFEMLWLVEIAILNFRNSEWNAWSVIVRIINLHGNIATWYLPCLFIAELMFCSIIKTGNLQYVLFLICFCVGVFAPESWNKYSLVILRALVGVSFLAIGYFGAKIVNLKVHSILGIALVAGYVIICLTNHTVMFYVRTWGNCVYFIVTACLGSFLLLKFCQRLSMNNSFISDKLSVLGRHTLYVMCIHMHLLEVFRLVDYKILGNRISQLGEFEGFIVAVFLMVGCAVFYPLFAKKISWAIGR